MPPLILDDSARLEIPDYRLTTAEILYHMPDFPALLQTFIWQQVDLAPRFPVLHKFLDYWEANLDGALHSVRVATSAVRQRRRNRYRHVISQDRLH